MVDVSRAVARTENAYFRYSQLHRLLHNELGLVALERARKQIHGRNRLAPARVCPRDMCRQRAFADLGDYGGIFAAAVVEQHYLVADGYAQHGFGVHELFAFEDGFGDVGIVYAVNKESAHTAHKFLNASAFHSPLFCRLSSVSP